jgi:hypothetical protein
MKQPFDLDEHKALGAELAAIRDRLQKIGIEVANRYGVSSPLGRKAARLEDGIDGVRSALDSQAVKDLRDEFDVHLYYPDAKRPE